ncbi:1,4-dihydroxy-2-naphthoate polyprenyltransferase [Sciscionella sediminilitoris]|uniref:1,4-dihydroxy-2-naphthoate polyprenyltransferase n=1 Tax=Sciscionella sediminilitoris TaxID=1445613 RepID=UPI0004DF572E|nr:1,4-dihydroxy-2-naphthoate polyprenyltransferase [Sciscionella sp. SE31]
MATTAQWVEGARLRTLPNAIAPVLVGTGAAVGIGGFQWWAALCALIVSLALIVGVNFANDYSDGVRGTDDERVGPLRLVGSGAASANTVRAAAFTSFGIAAVAGLVLVIGTGQWWLLAVGAVCILAAWFYTGGSHPYGYAGFGEPAVFLFFGLVAVLGTQYVQAGRISWPAILCAVAVGSFSAGVLIANNLRDVHTDPDSGKVTLAVRLGAERTRIAYVIVVVAPLVISVVLAPWHPFVLLGLFAAVLVARGVRTVASGTEGPALIPVLKDTGLAMLAWSVLTGVGLAL